jgi:hypothetical protein
MSFQDIQLDKLAYQDKKLAIYCAKKTIFDEVLSLLEFHCPKCKLVCANGWSELKSHASKVHSKEFCEICIKNKKVFTHEHFLYSVQELVHHNHSGDKFDPSFKGHPLCGFCNKHFYDKDQLFEHCRDKHETCFLCKRRGILDVYYENYAELENHFKSDHYVCREAECLEKKFIVFDSDIDLKAHDMEQHPSKHKKGKGQAIEVNFQYGISSHRQKPKRDTNRRDPTAVDLTYNSSSNVSSFLPDTSNVNPLSTNGSLPISRSQAKTSSTSASRAPPGFGSSLTSSQSKPSSPGNQSPVPMDPSVSVDTNQSTDSLQGDPETIQQLERIFQAKKEKYREYNSLLASFQTSALNADEFLLGLVSLAAQGRPSHQKKEVERDVGKLWHRLIDIFPDESSFPAPSKGKSKKRGTPLNLSSAPPSGKKELMLKAWNNYKVKVFRKYHHNSLERRGFGLGYPTSCLLKIIFNESALEPS